MGHGRVSLINCLICTQIRVSVVLLQESACFVTCHVRNNSKIRPIGIHVGQSPVSISVVFHCHFVMIILKRGEVFCMLVIPSFPFFASTEINLGPREFSLVIYTWHYWTYKVCFARHASLLGTTPPWRCIGSPSVFVLLPVSWRSTWSSVGAYYPPPFIQVVYWW